jgi:glutamate formiminotransferase
VLECVVNVSEGRDASVLTELRVACGPSLLDLHVDTDHHRSVFTLAGPGPHDAEAAARALARAVAARVSLVEHEGVHPRFGALDVVPFVALGEDEPETATRVARDFGHWWSDEFAVPVFFYDDADPEHRDLPTVRRTAFSVRMPDAGPPDRHATLGATAVGARAPLVAINCLLDTASGDVAVDIARHTRARDGGLPGVRALGLVLASRGRAQVSMNLVDLEATGVEAACDHVRALARARGTDVVDVELVGLLPRAELGRCRADFRAWSGLGEEHTIEGRLTRPPGN